MRFLLAIVLFAAAVSVFTLFARQSYLRTVEEELTGRALAALREAGYERVEVEFDHFHAVLGGTVDREEDKLEVLELLERSVPGAQLPSAEAPGIGIRPTLPPRVVVEAGGGAVVLRGALGSGEEAVRSLLGSRLHALDEAVTVDNTLEMDPMRLPFGTAAEFASLAVELLRHSEEVYIELDGGVLTVRGEVPNIGLKEAVLELAGAAAAGRVVDEIEVAPPPPDLPPASLKVTRNRFGVALAGEVVDPALRKALLAAAGAGGVRVVDRIDVSEAHRAGGWEEHGPALVAALLESLAGDMGAEFAYGRIAVRGRPVSEEARDALRAALKDWERGGAERTFAAEFDEPGGEDPGEDEAGGLRIVASHEEGRLVLEGSVPDRSFLGELRSLLEGLDPPVELASRLEEGSGVAAEWLERLPEFFAEALERVRGGSYVFADGRLRMEGVVDGPADRQILQNVAVNTVAGALFVENHLALPGPPPEEEPPALGKAERAELAEGLAELAVYFGVNSDTVTAEGRGKLEETVELLAGLGESEELKVIGFADNVGNPQYNMALSLRRAEAVKRELVALGLAEGNLTVESRGEDATHVARSERWKSRRVEISLVDAPGDGASEDE